MPPSNPSAETPCHKSHSHKQLHSSYLHEGRSCKPARLFSFRNYSLRTDKRILGFLLLGSFLEIRTSDFP